MLKRRARNLAMVLATVMVMSSLLSVTTVAGDAASKYNDGVYIGVSDASRGYVLAIVAIENDEIVMVNLAEMNDKGVEKDDTYAWENWHEAMRVLPGKFVEANGTDIDTFTGATSTSTKAIQAVDRALYKAQVDKGDAKYFDGTFMGVSPADERSYGLALVTIENDKIVAVELQEVLLPDYSFKDFATYPHANTVEGRLVLQERFVEANSADVDGITGSTGSSSKWKAAVAAALEMAKIQ